MPEQLSRTKRNILLVEDNGVDVFLNTNALKRIGVTEGISVVPNGRQALDILNSGSGSDSLPDVILLDLHMPIMDGFAFIKAFNEMTLEGKEKVLTIVVSCSNWQKDLDRVSSLGIRNYLMKPVKPEDMRRVFEENGILLEE